MAFLLAVWAGAASLAGQVPPAKEATAAGARILAQTIEQNGDQVSARGGVRIFYRDLILLADHVELNTKTKDALAEGHVSIQLPNEVISAERTIVNLDTGLGRIEDAFGLMKPSLEYSSDRMERESEDFYKLGKTRFTICSQAVPRWSFACARANMKRDEYVEMWGVTFSVKKIPIFYFPYLKFPLAEERATGFLVPSVGYSGVKGLSLSQSFYWNIARNQDATFTLDMYGTKGLGGGLEYRYIFSNPKLSSSPGLFSGQAQLYYFAFKTQADGTKPDNAYLVRWSHNQVLPGGFNLTAAVDYQNSFDFLREFDNNFKRAVVFNRRSQVYLSRTWGAINLSARASQFETNFQAIGNAIISRSLPQVSLNLMSTKVLGPVYFSMAASYNNWQYGWKTQFETGTQLQSRTLNFNPVVSVPFSSIPWLTVNTSLTGNINYFFTSRDTGTGAVVNQPYLAANYALVISAIGPVFYRTYNIGRPAPGQTLQPKLKHLIEPSVTYRFEPPWADPERIVSPSPYYRNHLIVYGLTNRFFYKSTIGAPKEVLTWGLSQTYYVSPDESRLGRYVIEDPLIPEGIHPRFSDISTYVRFYPGAKTSLDFGAAYNTYKGVFSQTRLGFNLGYPMDDFFFRMNWYLSVNPWYEGRWSDRHQISAAAGAKIPKLNLEAVGEIDYNVLEKKLLYVSGSLVYHYQCIDFRVESRVFFFREVPEFQFRFSFDLGGVGKSNDFLGGSRLD